ncbi:hypothetical protein BJ138DRAFT_1182228 [Hygrophoropsis aurantiaca]|uniref:Uncharacterized protein n=1 Tax=Hygrophoropsis aurantiaca TaxID=72124 RepID=A0ACB8A3G7_9AGAM|nr:hypothetical protein BJ138DRAFT_1182228 [Hygrophoropsis aurantiaca]
MTDADESRRLPIRNWAILARASSLVNSQDAGTDPRHSPSLVPSLRRRPRVRCLNLAVPTIQAVGIGNPSSRTTRAFKQSAARKRRLEAMIQPEGGERPSIKSFSRRSFRERKSPGTWE